VQRSRRQVTAVALSALLALAGCGQDEGRRAQPAQSFVDSIGVNVHMGYTDTAYGRLGAVRAALRQLGVRNVRDGVSIGREDQYAALRALGRDGVRADLILGDPLGRFGTGTVEQQVGTVKRELLSVTRSVEGPNEFDGSGARDWPRLLRAYQERLYGLVKGDPELSVLPVVGPSLIDMPAWPRVGDLSRWIDYGNIHPYPGGEPLQPDRLSVQLEQVARSSRSEPVMATETGYHNALSAPPVQQPGVSERAAAAYVPRLFFEHFRAGIERTFEYELVDERPEPAGRDAESHFGLLRSDFSRKPAFLALANTIALLEDPGPSFRTGSLDFALKSGDSVGRLLLQKRDGTFYLVLWRPGTSAWSRAAHTDLSPAPVAVRVRLGEPAERVRSYAPVRSTRPLESWEGAESVRLELGVEPLVLEIRAG
jgi:hypothetical protein